MGRKQCNSRVYISIEGDISIDVNRKSWDDEVNYHRYSKDPLLRNYEEERTRGAGGTGWGGRCSREG